MISVEEAQVKILSKFAPTSETEWVPLMNSLGRVIAHPIVASFPVPPFTNTSMDGYAVQSQDTRLSTQTHPITLTIIDHVAAGHPSSLQITPGTAIKVMTGAPLPQGADAVVQIEWTTPHPDTAEKVNILQSVSSQQNLRFAGEDVAIHDVAITPGTRITAPIIGMLATLGLETAPVFRRPTVGILSTGDELVDIGHPLQPGQIYNSNGVALAAQVLLCGGIPHLLPPAPDHINTIIERLDTASQYDIILSSGGVSVGDFDYVKDALESHGHLDFWRVNMKPGKPVTFGQYRTKPFMGLPGNPVSALMTFELFVRPLLLQFQGVKTWRRTQLLLPLADDFSEITDRRHYVRCRLETIGGQIFILPHSRQGSAIQSSWAEVEALMIVEENTGPWPKGTLMPVMLLN